MSERQAGDKCPFCDAQWGECAHAQWLEEWEASALEFEASTESSGWRAGDAASSTGQAGRKAGDDTGSSL